MTRTLGRLGTPLVLSALLVGGLTASAGAAGTGLGDATTADGTVCGPVYTYLQTASGADSYRVPSAGVITAWQFGTPALAAPATVGFRLGRASGGGYAIVGAGPDVTVTPGVRVEQPVRIPAQAGDLLGLYVSESDEGSQCARVTSAVDGLSYVAGNVTSGPMGAVDTDPGYRISVAATLEPDADADGYGDLTQDLCPSDATTQGACAAPETTAGKARIKKLVKGKRQVTVAFSASKAGGSFQCALDSTTKFKPCASPYRAKLKVGKHVLRIRAVGANGQVESTPAVVRIKIKK